MNILIVTWSEDNECINNVTENLQQKGANVYRFDTDLYPTEIMISSSYVDGKRVLDIKAPTFEINSEQIDAIWYRRMRLGQNLPKDIEKQLYMASLEESKLTFIGLMSCAGKFTLDPYHKIRYTGNKQLQLQIASEVGLDIPKTIFTNDANDVKAFYKEVNTTLITKMQHSFAVYENGQENVVFTNELTEEHLDDLDGLEICPMTFQEKIEKDVELRITIAGDQVFTACMDSKKTTGGAKTDWRRDGVELIHSWEKYDLPKAIEEKLLKLMDRLGLNYGAADVIVTHDGRFVFLEVNPSGEFFWLDELFEGQISEAISNVLLGKGHRRTNNILIEDNWI